MARHSVTVVARRGQVVALKAQGLADLETRRPLRSDDIFQIQSMTQPITVVAVLMLLEEGRFLLSDPIARFLPEFADTKVAVPQADAPDGHVLVPMRRGITLHDLLTHRAGFVGVPPSINPPAEALRRKALQSLPVNHDFTLRVYRVPRVQFDHRVVRQPEEFRNATGIAAHRGEEPFAPVQHAAAGRGNHGFAAQEIGRFEGRNAQAHALGRGQRLRHVGRVHEAEAQRGAPEPGNPWTAPIWCCRRNGASPKVAPTSPTA